MQLEATGKSVEIAIQNGLLECGMKREEVEIKVLEEGGLFKKAKVLLTWGEPKPEVQEEASEVIEEQTETVSESVVEEAEEEQEEVVEVVEKKKRIVNTDRLEEKGKDFLLGLAKFIDENATVSSQAKENEISFVVTGKEACKNVSFMQFGWSSIQGISRRLQRFIDLRNIEEQAKTIQEAMEYDYKKGTK